MSAQKWKSPMMKGRGLRTINALPPPPPPSRIPLLGSQMAKAPRPPRKPLTGPTWFVPGFEQLAFLDPRRR